MPRHTERRSQRDSSGLPRGRRGSRARAIWVVPFVSLVVAAAGGRTFAEQISCGPGYVPPGGDGCCSCEGVGIVHVSCGNTSHCCSGSSMCKGASQSVGAGCDDAICRSSKFNFSIREFSTNLETSVPLPIAGALNEPFHVKAGVLQPSGAPDAVVTMLDAGGQPLIVNGAPVVLTPICGATSGPGSLSACEPATLSPPPAGERWIEYESQAAIPSDPNGSSVPYQYVAIWASLEPSDAVAGQLDRRQIGGWISTDQDDLYALPAPDIFSVAQMDPLLQRGTPTLGEAGLAALILGLAAAGLAVLKIRQV